MADTIREASQTVVQFPTFGNKAPSIIGIKFNDLNGNGKQDAGEPGVGGVTVFVDIDSNGIQGANEPFAVTNASGAYQIPNPVLVDGTTVLKFGLGDTYQVREVVPAGARNTTQNPVSVKIPANADARVDFGNLYGSNAIMGCKFLDLNNNGKREGNEPGIAGVKVYLDNGVQNNQLDPGEAFTITNQFGEFSFSNLPAGTYRVREEKLNYPQSTPPGSIPELNVVLTGDGTPANPFQTWGCALVGNTPTYNVTVHKFRDDNANGLQDGTEPNLPNTPFFIDVNRNGIVDGAEVVQNTDTAGNVTFTNLLAGTYQVREDISNAPFRVATFPNDSVQEVVVGPGAPFAQQNPLLNPAPTDVPLLPWEPTPATGTQPSVPRTYQVQTSLPSLPSAGAKITYSRPTANAGSGPVGNARPNLNIFKFVDLNANGAFDVAPSATSRDLQPFLAGVQWDSPQSGVQFKLYKDNAALAANTPLATATTDANGRTSFQALEPGTYLLQEVVPGGFSPVNPNPVSVNITNDDALVQLGDTPNSIIKGCKFTDLNNNGYRDGNEPGVAGITIFLDQNNNGLPDDDAQYITTTDKDGNWQFNNLTPGSYHVREVLPGSGGTQTTPQMDILLGPNETFSCAPIGNSQFYDLYVKKFQDNNRNGLQENGEPPLVDVPFILDYNRNQIQDPNEPLVRTDANGVAVFKGIAQGNYSVFELQPFGLQIGTTPNPYPEVVPGSPRAVLSGAPAPLGYTPAVVVP